jgi:hypothetical protein
VLDGFDVEIDGPYVDLSAALPRPRSAWREADTELRRLAARRCALDAAEAHWLRAARDAQVHRHLGFGTFVEYVERTLGYRPRTALERLRVADALAALPALNEALDRGRVTYSTVRELSRVASPETEHAWLAAVAGKTVREVADMVAGRALGDDPAASPDPDLASRRLRLDLSPDVYARFLAARRQLEEECGERLSDDDVMASLCDAVLAPADGRGPRSQIAVTVCATCDRGWQDVAGQTIEVSSAAVELARCDAQQVGRVDGDAPAPITADIPVSVRRQVERRDRRRCVVPGCRCSRYLHMHHIVPRESGGAHVARNLCLLCTAHHRAAHDGRLRIDGEAPALTFEHEDGRPYGAPPGPRPPNGASIRQDHGVHDHGADTHLALRTLGFSDAVAAAAVNHARAHVDAQASLEDWIREALRACRQPGS